jgi:hypothetical protein
MPAKVLRNLNAEQPDGMAYGLVIVYEGDERGAAQAENATLLWFKTEREMNAAWMVAYQMADQMIERPIVKALDALETTQYAIVANDFDYTYVGWGPKEEWVERLAVSSV